MRNILLFLFLLTTLTAQAQETVPMADQLRTDGKIWVVVATVAIVLLGFFVYLIRIDSRISKLEKHN